MLITRHSRRGGGMGDMGFGLPSISDLKKAATVLAPVITIPVLAGAKVVGAVAPKLIEKAPKALPFIAPAITVPFLAGTKLVGAISRRINNDSPAPAAPVPSTGVRRLNIDDLNTVKALVQQPYFPPANVTSPGYDGGGGGGGGGGGYTLPDGTVVPADGVSTSLVGKFNALSTPMKLGLVALVGGGIYFAAKHFGGASAGHAPKSAQSLSP